MREALERDSGRGNLRDTLREWHSGERQSERGNGDCVGDYL